MTVEAGLFAILTEDATVSSLVGERVYPVLAPEGSAVPDIIYHESAVTHFESQTGPSNMAKTTIRLDCWADSLNEAKTIADAARRACQAFTHGVAGGTRIASLTFMSGISGRADYDEDTKLFRYSIETVIYHATAGE